VTVFDEVWAGHWNGLFCKSKLWDIKFKKITYFRRAKMKIVYSYYVLDIVHKGHLEMMKNAKAIAV